jgi:hypothetical protein
MPEIPRGDETVAILTADLHWHHNAWADCNPVSATGNTGGRKLERAGL